MASRPVVIRVRSVVLVAALTLLAPVTLEGAHGRIGRVAAAPWREHIEALDRALAGGDVRAAEAALHEAHQAAMAGRRWEAMIAFGDAAARLARVAPELTGGLSRARRAYLLAFDRARHFRSLDGVLRVAEAFGALGDSEVALGCARAAEPLARDETERATVLSHVAWHEARLLAGVTGF